MGPDNCLQASEQRIKWLTSYMTIATSTRGTEKFSLSNKKKWTTPATKKTI